MPDDEYEPPDEFLRDEQQEQLFELVGFFDDTLDQHAHDLFWAVMYNDELTVWEREDLRFQLADHLWEEYGLDFEYLWDWEDFREWYETA
jgi:hypothetical protein